MLLRLVRKPHRKNTAATSTGATFDTALSMEADVGRGAGSRNGGVDVGRLERSKRDALREHRLLKAFAAGFSLGSRASCRSSRPAAATVIHRYSPTGKSICFWKPTPRTSPVGGRVGLPSM